MFLIHLSKNCRIYSKECVITTLSEMQYFQTGVSFYSDRSIRFGIKGKTKRYNTHFSYLILYYLFAYTNHVFD